MSNISLEGNASGTGTFTIAAPNTSSNFTLTLPQATGTVLTGTANSASPYETALGSGALQSNTTGIYNVAVGYNAANANTTGYSLAALGHEALKLNTTGKSNNAFGAFALEKNTTGNDNVAVGNNALNANTTGSSNTAVGHSALLSNTTGADNTAVGSAAADAVTTAQKVVAVGFNAGGAITTGNSNVCIGADSGAAITTGTLNIALGRENLQSLTTGNYNTHVGYATTAGAAGRASAIVICSGANGATDKGDNTGFIAPNSNGAVYQGNNSSSWSTTSDQRLKKNIVDNIEGLEKINAIQVRNFEYRLPEEVTDLDPSCAVGRVGVQLGVIAQELQQVCSDCVKEESTGVLSVDSDNIFWHMVNAIKQLNAKVEALEAQLATPPATPSAEPNA
jgi:hypothetical protein